MTVIIDKVEDKKLLQKLSLIISKIEKASEIKDMPNAKKIKGFSSFYRIKIGDYRLGIELTPENEIEVECQNDPQKYYEHIQQIQKQYSNRLVRFKPKPALKLIKAESG